MAFQIRSSIKRFAQFTLRGLLAFVLVIAVMVAIPANRARDQQQIVAAIRALGGRVSYQQVPTTAWRQFIDRGLGQDFHLSVDRVWLDGIDGRQLEDIGLWRLRGDWHCEVKRMCNATDGLKSLGRAERLSSLRWFGGDATSEALLALRGAKQLRGFSIFDMPVMDGTIEQLLPQLGELRSIGLHGTQLTDRSLKAIARKPLKHLGLSKAAVTDDGFAELDQLNGDLEYLCLCFTSVSDKTARRLRRFQNLRELGLARTNVSSAELANLLPHLLKLRWLDIAIDFTNESSSDLLRLAQACAAHPSLTSVSLDYRSIDATMIFEKVFRAQPKKININTTGFPTCTPTWDYQLFLREQRGGPKRVFGK